MPSVSVFQLSQSVACADILVTCLPAKAKKEELKSVLDPQIRHRIGEPVPQNGPGCEANIINLV